MKQIKKSRVLSQTTALLLATSLISPFQIMAFSTNTLAASDQVHADAGQALSGVVKEALERMKKLYPQLHDYPFVSVNDQATDNVGNPVVEIFLSQDRDRKDAPHATVIVDSATGSVQGFQIMSGKSMVNPPTYALAKEKTDVFLPKLLGSDILQHYKPSSQEGLLTSIEEAGSTLNLRSVLYERVIDGIIVEGDALSLAVDADGGIAYLHRLAASKVDKLPDRNNLLSVQQASAKFPQFMDLVYVERMTYKGALTQTEKSRPALLYATAIYASTMDAKTGKYFPTDMAGRMYSFSKGPVVKTNPGGKVLFAKNEQEAANLLTREFGISLKGMVYAPHAATPAPGRKSYIWESATARIELETRNNQLIGFETSLRSTGSQPKPKISEQQAAKMALPVLQTYLQKDVKELLPSSQDVHISKQKYPIVTFGFSKVHSGIPVADRNYSVSINLETGKVAGIHGDFDQKPVPLPPANKRISPEQAAANFLKAHPLELRLIKQTYVYRPQIKQGDQFVDAMTGQVLTP
ncbi:MAG: PepSY domain-containing protein [Clostridia bacterium]